MSTMQKSFESLAGNLPENVKDFALSLAPVTTEILMNLAENLNTTLVAENLPIAMTEVLMILAENLDMTLVTESLLPTLEGVLDVITTNFI